MPAPVRKAGKTRTLLDIPARDTQGARPQLPLLKIRGSKPGPLAVFMACQHGRELNGIAALARAFDEIDAEKVRGDIVFLPVMNPLAVRIRQQDYPFEDARYRTPVASSWNMNRTWRVDDERRTNYAGRITEHVWREFVQHADVVLDLHGWAGLSWAWSLRKHTNLLLSFGLPCNQLHDKPPAPERGMLETAAVAAGIPIVTAEFMPQNKVSPESVAFASRGALNLLRHTGILPGKPELPPEQYIFNERHVEYIVKSPCEGLLEHNLKAGQFVERGEHVLNVRSLDTLETVFSFKAPRRSLVFSIGGIQWGEDMLESDVVAPGQLVAILKVPSRVVMNSAQKA